MIEIQKHVGNVSGIGQMCAALSLHCGRLVQRPDTQMVAWRARLGCNGFFSYRWVNERAGGRAKILHARMLACVHDCWGRVHGKAQQLRLQAACKPMPTAAFSTHGACPMSTSWPIFALVIPTIPVQLWHLRCHRTQPSWALKRTSRTTTRQRAVLRESQCRRERGRSLRYSYQRDLGLAA